MAGQTERWRALWLLLFVCLALHTVEFELTEEDWEELPTSLLSLHRLRGLPNQFTHEDTQDTHIPLLRLAKLQRRIRACRVSAPESVLQSNMTEKDIFEDLKGCQDLPQCLLQNEQDFKDFLAHIEGQKLYDVLLSASELSSNYQNKVLLMMDEEADTLQRAEEEHLKDPLNSMKVGQACLRNDACLTKVHRDTVVRIFGRTSENGSSVSDYDGSTLATKLLQTELKTASLFSIDGNTNISFQRDFMRVFKTHELSAVLETDKHSYQILDRADLAVKYTPKISQQGMDRTTQYDAQSILIMQDDPVVREAATFLYEKHPTVSSVYMLDQNGRPKLIKGDPLRLSPESRLVLVGHGKKDSDEEMRLAGYRPEEVAEIASRMPRVGGVIKTTSVVACEVGSDESFIRTLLKELHARSVDTELHLRNSLLEVSHLGEKATVEITPRGLVWRQKDDRKKVIAGWDNKRKIAIRIQSNSKGKEIFSNEMNFLGDSDLPDIQPTKPMRVVDNNVRQPHTDVLEGLAWAFFGKPEAVGLNHIVFNNNDEYIVKHPENEKWLSSWDLKKNNNKGTIIFEESQIKDILKNCYEINSINDVRNIINHYARSKEKVSYLMLHDWIFKIDEALYVFPIGKRLNNNEKGNSAQIEEITKSITEQVGKESYTAMRLNIGKETEYVSFVRNILSGSDEYTLKMSKSTEAWRSTYFLASIVSESSRNFRAFPIILMALSMCEGFKKKGLDFLLAKNPMAQGGSWISPKKRGFYGSSSAENDGQRNKLKDLIQREGEVFDAWLRYHGTDTFTPDMISHLLNGMPIDSLVTTDYNDFENAINKATNQEQSRDFSGALGGSTDGAVTAQDLHAYANVEQSMKLSSHYSRSSSVLSETIQDHLGKQFGLSLGDFVMKPDSIKVKDRDCFFETISKKNPHETRSYKVQLPEEVQLHMDTIRKSMQSISEMEIPEAGKVQKGSGHLERTGMALGVMGLMLGAQGAVQSFERGDIEHGVMGTLQTAHGVTGLSMAVLGKQMEVNKNIKMSRNINTLIRNSVSKVALRAIPLVGIGFGIDSLYEDFKRGDALGNIDAVFDLVMIELDVIELAVPALVPIIAPLNLAISAIRMVFDDVYLSIESELNSLPPNAGVLDKIRAFFRGFGKGSLHFILDLASFFYTIPYREIEEGRRLVQQISDYQKYFSFREVQDGRKAIDFTGGEMSMSGGLITFCLSDHRSSEFCMDKFVSSETTIGRKCWLIDTSGTKDIILGIGESQQLQYSTIHRKVGLFIPAGSIDVVSGYKAIPNTRYGTYKGNNLDNKFFAVQTNEDKYIMELMLSYYYLLYGKNGDDTFFFGPQRSYVEGQGGRDTYIIPSDGGSTVINNYDPVKTMDLLMFNVSFHQLSVSKSGNDVVLSFGKSHNVRILNWFVGEDYRHINMMSEDGVSFEISSVVVSSVKLIAQSINMMSKTQGQTVDASRPPLHTVINILGSTHNDQLTGNAENNFIDGGGGSDRLRGMEGEDIYMVKKRTNSAVSIINYSSDNKEDMMILEAKIHDIKVRVNDDDLILLPFADQSSYITLVNWFHSEEYRHLVIVTEDFITFTVSADKSSCMVTNPFANKCILSQHLDYSKSKYPLQVDLEGDEVYQSVTEVRGSDLNDNIKGNGRQNIMVPGKGQDFLQGRGGKDWYIVTPGDGMKTIDNYSPDLSVDTLYIREQYEFIECKCDGENLKVLINGTQQVLLKGWFVSIMSQHLQILSSDGVTFKLPSSKSFCQLILLTNNATFQEEMDLQMFHKMSATMANGGIKQSILVGPCFYDVDETDRVLEVMCRAEPTAVVFRSSFPGREEFQDHGCPYADQPLFSSGSMSRTNEIYKMVCKYKLNLKYPQTVDNRLMSSTSPMFMNENNFVSVLELFGSSGFDVMTGNAKDNTLDPYTGGGLMAGLDGKDTYVVKSDYGTNIVIDNFSEDMREDTVLFEADFFSGSITVLSEGYDVQISAKDKGHNMKALLLHYHQGEQHQHLSFLTSDGVHFRLLNDTNPESLLIKAYKIKLEDKQTDCRIDLNAHTNLSAVHTVQGCSQQSNNIEGNDLDNALTGGVKLDFMNGGPGHDTLMGGQGDDILLGGSGDDTLYGEEGDDTMMGGSGSDAFIPGPGADLVDGGAGRDTVFYQGDHNRGEGVYVNLLTGECRQADAEGDVLKDVENVVGTIYSDILVSGYEPALLKGSDGNDVLVSQGGDYLIGGDGSDVYMMVSPRGTVVIDNCADDNATDVLYLRSMSADSVHCTQTNTSMTLSFKDQAKAVELELKDWFSGDTCRHLQLILREGQTSVEKLQEKCKANEWRAKAKFAMPFVFCFCMFLVYKTSVLIRRAFNAHFTNHNGYGEL